MDGVQAPCSEGVPVRRKSKHGCRNRITFKTNAYKKKNTTRKCCVLSRGALDPKKRDFVPTNCQLASAVLH
uniref:Uncharacterized protein n=1 Tax=Anguilla anguilla TaxID=7936 RepID=A0A0E9S4D3_ANGAN